jgi:hypothetical protein
VARAFPGVAVGPLGVVDFMRDIFILNEICVKVKYIF